MLWNAWISPNLLNLGFKSWKTGKPTLTPSMIEKHVVVTILEPTHKSQPPPTIHYTYIEKLEGLRCCHLLESIWKHTILVWNVGYWSWSCHHPWLKSRGVVMVVHDELKSQPCKTIHYTYNEILEGLRCCRLPEPVQTYWILVSKVENRQVNFDPIHDWKTHCGYHLRARTPISIFSNHSLY